MWTPHAYQNKAMPVFLRSAEEVDVWLRAPWKETIALQRPLPAEALRVIDPPPKRQACGRLRRFLILSKAGSVGR